MSSHRNDQIDSHATNNATRAPDGPPRSTAEPPATRSAPMVLAGFVAALLFTAGMILASTGPVQAATYRDIKSVRFGSCLYAYGDPLEDLTLRKCSTTPAKYGNWTVTNAGYYNNHPLWIITRQGGKCLGVLGSASHSNLYSSCNPTNSRNVWEVFDIGKGRLVLKSFGAYQGWRQHKCLNFSGPYGIGEPQLGPCSLSSTTGMINR